MAIKVLGDIVIDDDRSLKNVTSITYGDASVQTTAQTGVPPNIITTHTAGALIHTLDNPNAYSTSAGDYFGRTVATSGNYAIVGAYQEDDAGGASSGKAYIYNVTTGALIHTLNNPNAFSTSAGDWFGLDVAISGNYAIVGAYQEDDAGGASSGKAYIYNVTTGTLIHTLDNPNAFSTSAGDYFNAVAISGNYAIVGAQSEDDAGGADSGKAYIFNVTTGALVHTLNNPNAYNTSAYDVFGRVVAISGNYAIVGADQEDDAGGAFSGKAYIFNVTTGALVYTLNNPNAYSTSSFDQFGETVAISGNYAIVGARLEDDAGGASSGKAYIYNVTTGALVHTLNNPNAYSTSAGDGFGRGVAISGNYAAVCAPVEDDADGLDSGKVYIFNVTTGALVHTLNNPNAYSTSAGDGFATSVSLSGNYLIAGVWVEDDAGGADSGKAYIFSIEDSKQISNIASLKFANGTDIAPTLNRLTRVSATRGELIHILNNPNMYSTSTGDAFGTSVAISGNYAIVGANAEDDTGGAASGKAYIYNVTTGELLQILNNPNAFSTSASDSFGRSVGISGNYAIVSASSEDDAGGTNSGKAYVYNITTGALVHTLNNPNAYGASGNDSFGTSVAISGKYAIVGAFNESDAGGASSGKAYIFNVITGGLVHTLNNPNAFSTSPSDFFGDRVAISGNYAIVGAYGEDDDGGDGSGKAYIYNVTTGALLYTLNNPNAYSTGFIDQFGSSVAISDNYAVVGAPQEDDASGAGSGKAYVFNLTTGSLIHTLNNPNAYGIAADDVFGTSVAISSGVIVVGSSGEAAATGATSGKVYVYNVTTGALVHTLNNPNAYGTSATDLFGGSVAISDNYIVAAASSEDDASGTVSGKAYIFASNNLTTLDRLYTLVSEA